MRYFSLPAVLFLSTCLMTASCGGSDEPEEPDATDDASGGGDAGGPIDTGIDVPNDVIDAGNDTDTGTDTGVDASADADAGIDASADADAGIDASADAGVDVVEDTSVDSGVDAGTELVVSWCRMQFPTDLSATTGSTFTGYGRVFAEGLTERSTATDPDERLIGELGVGPHLSTPDDLWTWYPGVPNDGWTDTDEPGNDEYQADVVVPEPGEYDLAWRFSADGGATWLLCDTRVEGSDGAADGYQPENAGRLLSTDPCLDACLMPPDPECLDAAILRAYSTIAECEVVEGDAVCNWEATDFDCSAAGLECMAGACVEDIAPPAASGDIVITEFMARSISGVDPGEWFELKNTTTSPLDLDGCSIGDDGGPDDTIDVSLVVPVGGYVVLAGSGDPADTGGLDPEWVWSTFALANAGDEIVLTCGDVEIDRVAYTASNVVLGTALQLASESIDAALNDDLANWCDATDTFGDAERLGTPGSANGDCRTPEWTIDWCRLQFPDSIEGPVGTSTPTYVRISIDGLTTRTSGVDLDDQVKVQIGLGPDGTDPTSTEGDLWTWTDAVGTPGWDDAVAGEPNNDEYTAALVSPDVPDSLYRYAGRVSGDGGLTWSYCDRNVGTGSDGLADGFQVENTGVMIILASGDVCEPNPCIEPPANECDSATLLKVYESLGSCVDIEGVASCVWTDRIVDCADSGLICSDGACVDGSPSPAVGDLVVTEIMAQSRSGTGDTGEFVEIYNASTSDFDLEGCSLGTLDAAEWTMPASTLIEAGGRLVFAASDVPAENGGLVGAIAWTGFNLNNGGDSVVIRCGGSGEVIDAVSYADTDVVLGISWQLDASKENAADNDLGTNWCQSTTGVAGYEYLGTPAEANLTCGAPTGLSVDWCNLQFPTTIEGFEGNLVDVYGRLFIEGLTDASTGPDAVPDVQGEVGFGPDGSLPSEASWSWVAGAVNEGFSDASNDEYVAALELPIPGVYDVAWRFTADGGATWSYCDTGDGLADGYAAANAGVMIVTEASDLCADVVCDTPPADSCDGPTNLVTHADVGFCSVVDSTPLCEYSRTSFDCSSDGRVCVDGVCVFETSGLVPEPGELVVSEIMPRAFEGTGDPGEFVELINTTDHELDLTGCSLGDADGAEWTFPAGTSVAAGGFVLAASSDGTDNGGLVAPIPWSGMTLANTGESLVVRCSEPAVEIDTVNWTAGDVALGVSISLDEAALRDDLNDDPNQWCPGFGSVDGYSLTGTPGAANPVCSFEPLTVGWCGIQWPPTINGLPGDFVSVFGVVWIDGLTNATTTADTSSSAWGEWGYGPDGADPVALAGSWTWVRGMPNAAYDDPANDEYMWSAELPAAGAYDYAWRFTGDHGETWTYCDNLPEGAGDGYSTDTTGTMTVE